MRGELGELLKCMTVQSVRVKKRVIFCEVRWAHECSYYSNLRMALKLGKLIKMLDLWKRQPYKDADNYG
jgi:hypothetical protein